MGWAGGLLRGTQVATDNPTPACCPVRSGLVQRLAGIPTSSQALGWAGEDDLPGETLFAAAGAAGLPVGAAVRLTLKGGFLRGGTIIKVRTLTGKEIEIDIDLTDTMQRVKERVEEKEGIPPVQQRLIFAGKQMNDDKTAKDYNIEGGSVLHLVLALRGGS